MNMEKDFIGPRMPLDIPLCLIISQEERQEAWIGHKYTSQFYGGADEAWRERETVRRELIAAEVKAKNARGLERMKEKHRGEKYDRKTHTWVRVDCPEGQNVQDPDDAEPEVQAT